MPNNLTNGRFAALYLWMTNAKFTMGIFYVVFVFFYLFIGKLAATEEIYLDLTTAIEMIFACFLIGLFQQIFTPVDVLTRWRASIWILIGIFITTLFSVIFKWFVHFPSWGLNLFIVIIALAMGGIVLRNYLELNRETRRLNRKLEQFQTKTAPIFAQQYTPIKEGHEMPMINVTHLKKNYGKHIGAKNVTFSVEEGEIFGFVGPNGAGKSTTIRTLLNLIFADSGKISIAGMDCVEDSKKIKEITGYVPSDVRLYPDMRLHELFKRNAGFYNQDQSAEIERLCKLFGLDITKRFRELSTGNKKKVALVCALAMQPRILILDEPTNGLDPMVQRELFLELKRQAAQGATVLLSSHNLTEVQEYCNRVAFIRNGEIIAITNLEDSEEKQRKIVTLSGGGKIPAKFKPVSENNGRQTFYTEADGAELLALLNEIAPTSFTVQNESIEDRFMSLYRGGNK